MSTQPRLPSAVEGQAPAFGTVFAHRPALLKAFGELYATLWQRGVLDEPTREVVRLRNARVTSCSF